MVIVLYPVDKRVYLRKHPPIMLVVSYNNACIIPFGCQASALGRRFLVAKIMKLELKTCLI